MAASADQQLLALKQKMGLIAPPSSPEKRQLGAGRAVDEETVQAEIEEHDEKANG